ncbi:hypothetical protein [Chromobacterium haemolyticum]|uniref:phage nozzle protein n=1 Tax=Chromobacterium haemolyticum TaxID=394935 RepID=UPI0011309198|nr:hypothetical protein [Chromobacterium haemolyticum]
MSLVSQSIKNMVAGVSQQPQILKMPDQADEQINGFSSEAAGLIKRPPTQHLAKLELTDSEVNNGFVHFINRDESEKYIAVITPLTDNPLPPPSKAPSGGITRSTKEALFLTPGSSQLPIPPNTVQVEIYALGGGGAGGGWKPEVPNSPGLPSSVKAGPSSIAVAGGGAVGERHNAPGAGGAPNGNPGQWAAKYAGGIGGRPPDNIFGADYGVGGQGHRDVGSQPSGGGGGSGGYVRAVVGADVLAGQTMLDITVGAGGKVNNWEAYGGPPGQPGNGGAVKVIFYIDEDNGGEPEKPLMDSSIRVFDLKGQEYAVRMSESGLAYLAGASGGLSGAIRAVTVADYTFIMNRLKVTQMTSKKSGAEPNEALIHVKQGQYGKTYSILINGEQKAAFTTPDGSNAGHSPQIDTSFITTKLCEQLTENGVNFNNGKNWIRIYLAGEDDAVTTADGFGDQAMFSFTHKVQKVGDLPKSAPDGYVVAVVGDNSTTSDNYWLKYSLKSKTWEETVGFDLEVEIDGSTMPHALIRQADGTFTFDALEWDERKIGDDNSNPIPSFIGYTLHDIFFFRNRLGVIADENVVMTAAGKFFKFWTNSAATVVDTDPIDVAVSNNAVSLLQHAVPFNEELLLFSDGTQFVMKAEGVLSPKSIRVDKATDFLNTPNVRPITVGRNAYFVMEKTGSCDVIEFFAGQDAIIDGIPVTSHVPSYIPQDIRVLKGASADNLIVLNSRKAPGSLFVYKFLFSDQGRVQSSWSRWDFGGGKWIVSYEFIGPYLYLVVGNRSGYYLERMQTNPDVFEYPAQPWKIHLDRLAEYTLSSEEVAFDEHTLETVFNIKKVYGSIPAAGDYFVVDELGDAKEVQWDVEGSVRIYGDFREQRIWIGEVYPFRYTFSRFLIKHQNENGWVTETEGRLQLRRGHVNFNNSGPFTVLVECIQNSCARESTYTGRQLGSMTSKVGRIPVGTGRFNFPIGREATDARVMVLSTNPYPCAFIGAGWEGVHSRRTSQI